jgi:cytochrome c554/c'-like protein
MRALRRVRLYPVQLGLGLLLAFLGACTTEEIVQPFNPPPDTKSGFLGFFTVETKQTTCGNCHVGEQADWVKTAHANAWQDLQSSADFNGTCAGAGCHSVNWRGNQDSAKVGYEAVQTDVYQDVQCESCHGPGNDHVQNPSVDENRPLASINVTDDPTLEDRSCSGCHRGGAGPDKHQNYLKEWKSSRHGQLREEQAGEENCQPCHEAKGALRAWGINTDYKELGSDVLMPQNCVVCHDPHGTAADESGNPLPGQLRYTIASPVLQENLCTKCHGRVDRAVPNPTSSRGPHGVQGPVLLGEAGYFPPGSSYDTLLILTSHGSTANPRLCAGCHVNRVTGTDANGNTITFSGHSFHPLPCLMQKSPEIVDTTYQNDCAFDGPSRSWGACTASGCHGDEATAVSRLSTIRTEITGYLRTIWINSTKCQPAGECIEVPDPFPADSGYLALVAASKPEDLSFAEGTTVTPAKGAMFNVQITGDDYAGHPDGSHGVHNPFLYRALLQSTIADLQANYSDILTPPPAVVTLKIRDAIQSGRLKVAPATEQAIMRLPLR